MSIWNNDGSFESIKPESDYTDARKEFLINSLNLGAMALHDAFKQGGRLMLSPNFLQGSVILSFYDQMTNLAFNISCKPEQIIWPGSEAGWSLSSCNEDLKEQVRSLKAEIKSLKVILGEDGSVI